jgi:hypothetical protein
VGEDATRKPVNQADIDELRRLYTVKEYDNGSFGRVLREAQARLDGPTVQAHGVSSVDRKLLGTIVGATILANQPVLREFEGKYELDFNDTVPALVDVIHAHIHAHATREQSETPLTKKLVEGYNEVHPGCDCARCRSATPSPVAHATLDQSKPFATLEWDHPGNGSEPTAQVVILQPCDPDTHPEGTKLFLLAFGATRELSEDEKTAERVAAIKSILDRALKKDATPSPVTQDVREAVEALPDDHVVISREFAMNIADFLSSKRSLLAPATLRAAKSVREFALVSLPGSPGVCSTLNKPSALSAPQDSRETAIKTAIRVINEQASFNGMIKGTLWADDHTTLVELLESALGEGGAV